MKLPLSTTRRIDAILPKGTYRLRGVGVEAMHSSQETNSKAGLRHLAEIVEPEELAGASFFDKFWLGSDTDPDLTDPATYERGFGGRRHKTMLEACGIVDDLDGETIEEVAETLSATYAGQEYLADIKRTVQKETNRDGTPNAYAGQEQNDANAYYPIGEKEPRITDEIWLADQQLKARKGAGGPARTATPPARATPPVKATSPARRTARPEPVAETSGNGSASGALVHGKPTKATTKCSACKAPENIVYVDEWDAHLESYHPE